MDEPLPHTGAPALPTMPHPAVEALIVPRSRDVGGFEVRRALPSDQRMMVGPFIFFDQMGPVDFPPGEGLDVRPHPHINLATVTYLFEGGILHRDSLGTEVLITPGAVNWMTAGRGIVHSERTPPDLRARGARAAGLQTWLALPAADEETAPAFAHTPREALPRIDDGHARATLIVGTAWGERSPVATFCDTLYADVELARGGSVPVDAQHEERAFYVVSGAVAVDGARFDAGQFVVLRPGAAITLGHAGERSARVMIAGGETMDGPRHLWWNFVSSRRDRIEQAKADWRAGRFGSVPGDAQEFIPLPDDGAVVAYP